MKIRPIVVTALLLSATAARGRAQAPGDVLPDRLSPATRAAILRLIDSARTVGLPVSPLVDKTAEGVLKGADDQRILRAVQSLTRELGDARAALGGASDLALLGAAANALHAGVSPDELRRLQRASSTGNDALVSALVTLVDLVAKRVPVSSASNSIYELLDRRAGERQFAALRADVELDISAGLSPDAALKARVGSQLRSLDAAPLDARRPPIR
jgi:hypothetical protein